MPCNLMSRRRYLEVTSSSVFGVKEVKSNFIYEFGLWDKRPLSPLKSTTFRRNMSPPSSGPISSRTRKAQLAACGDAGILLGLFFDHEDKSDITLRNVSWLWALRRYISEDKYLHNRRCENVRSYKCLTVPMCFTSVPLCLCNKS
jgi:hypothetical protein